MYVWYVCMYVCMYVWMDGWMDGWMDVEGGKREGAPIHTPMIKFSDC